MIFYFVKKIKLWKVVNILLSLRYCFFKKIFISCFIGLRGTEVVVELSLSSGPGQWVWKGGVCEPGAALLRVHPARRLLPRRVHVHPHISRGPVSHCLHAAPVPGRRKRRRALPEGPWRENGGNGPGGGVPAPCPLLPPSPACLPPCPEFCGDPLWGGFFCDRRVITF